MGYVRRDCPNKKKQNDERNSDLSKSTNVVQNNDSDDSDGDSLSISSSQLMDSWILDTGCSFHMTPNKDWFDLYSLGSFGFIYLGNDKACAITTKG